MSTSVLCAVQITATLTLVAWMITGPRWEVGRRLNSPAPFGWLKGCPYLPGCAAGSGTSGERGEQAVAGP